MVKCIIRWLICLAGWLVLFVIVNLNKYVAVVVVVVVAAVVVPEVRQQWLWKSSLSSSNRAYMIPERFPTSAALSCAHQGLLHVKHQQSGKLQPSHGTLTNSWQEAKHNPPSLQKNIRTTFLGCLYNKLKHFSKVNKNPKNSKIHVSPKKEKNLPLRLSDARGGF